MDEGRATIDAPGCPSPRATLSLADIERRWGASLVPGATADLSLKHGATPPPSSATSSRLVVKTHSLGGGGAPGGVPLPTAAPPDYELLAVLGEGGMGVVYTARQTAVDRTIAVKMIKGEAARDEGFRAKFLAEAAVTGELDHPGIVPIHDLGADEKGRLFYAMKRVQGVPWSKAIRTRTLAENLEVLMRVADAVAFAHSHGVLHRDLKPDNVMLGDYGEVLLMDWGLAAAPAAAGPGSKAEPLSAANALGGTPAYMAPEMAIGETDRIDQRSDVYLLGAILHEIVTGEPPHEGKSASECLLHAAENRIRPTTRGGELLAIAYRAMATDPAERHPSVKDLQAAIAEYRAHAESALLAARAEEELARARAGGAYDDFARALITFEEAVLLWPGNRVAARGALAARLGYATRALERGDLDLARSLLVAGTAEPAELLGRVEAAIAEREAARRRLRSLRRAALSLTAAVIVLLAVGFVWIRAERDAAERARDQAVAAREGEARERVRAEEARARAERENYFNAIALTRLRIDARDYGQAGALLRTAPVSLRGWEWGRLAKLSRLERVTLAGHEKALSALAWSPDGTRLVTASSDGTARIWDAGSAGLVLSLAADAGGFSRVAWSRDGRLVATAGPEWTRVWDAASGVRLWEASGERRSPRLVAFSPDSGRLLVGAGNFLTARDAATGAVMDERKLPFSINALDPSPDGGAAAIAGLAGDARGIEARVIVLDLAAGTERRLPVRGVEAHAVAWSPDGKRVASAVDRTVQVWDVASARQVAIFAAHEGVVWSVAWSPDGIRLASASDDRTARVWDVASGQEVVAFAGHGAGVTAVAFRPDGRSVATASADRTARIWDIDPPLDRRVLDLRAHMKYELQAEVTAVAFSAGGERLFTASTYPLLKVWDPASGRELAAWTVTERPIWALALRPGGKELLVAAAETAFRLVDAETGRKLRDIPNTHQILVRALAWSPDGNRVLSGSGDQTAKVWDVATWQVVQTLAGHTLGVDAVAWSPDGALAATAAMDGTARLWDPDTGREVRRLTGHEHWVTAIAFAPDGREVVTASRDATARIWEVASGRERLRLAGHEGPVLSVAYVPDGKRVVTGGQDGTVRVWDVAGGREMLLLRGHARMVTALAVSPDGERIASGSGDETAVVWPALPWREGGEVAAPVGGQSVR